MERAELRDGFDTSKKQTGAQCIKATGSAALDNSNKQGCFAIA